MMDLHDGFGAWIAAGARDDLPRDVALHASGCDDCLNRAAAFDALLAIDPGMAPPPAVRTAPMRPATGGATRLARASAGAMAIVVMLGAGVVAASTLLRPRAAEPAAISTVEPTMVEGVLAGAPSAASSPTTAPSHTATIKPSPSPTITPRPTPVVVAAATPRPTMGGGPPPISTAPPATPTPRAATPAPTVAPTVAPTAPATPAPSPTAAPTTVPPPTESSTPLPSPSPTPSETP